MYIYLLRPRVCVSFLFRSTFGGGGGDKTGRRQNALRQEGQSKSVLLSSELGKNYNIHWKLLLLSLRREHSRRLFLGQKSSERNWQRRIFSFSVVDRFDRISPFSAPEVKKGRDEYGNAAEFINHLINSNRSINYYLCRGCEWMRARN